MELGALICKPTLPACSLCPLTESCNAFKKKDFIIRSKNKLNKVKYFEANIYKQKNKFLLIKNKKFNFLKNLVIFPMEEINQKKFNRSDYKKISVKMSNMNMKILINDNKKIKKTRNSVLLDKTNINKYILPSFTKKILSSLTN